MTLIIKVSAILFLWYELVNANSVRVHRSKTPTFDNGERFVARSQPFTRPGISSNYGYENQPFQEQNNYRNVVVGASYSTSPYPNTENRFNWRGNREQTALNPSNEIRPLNEAYSNENNKRKPFTSWSNFNRQPQDNFWSNQNFQNQGTAWEGKFQNQNLYWQNGNQKQKTATIRNHKPQKEVVISGDLNRQLQKSNQVSDTLEKQVPTFNLNNGQQQGPWGSNNFQQQGHYWSIGVHQKGSNEKNQGPYWGDNNYQFHDSNAAGSNDYQYRSNWNQRNRQQKRSDNTASLSDNEWSSWSNKVQQSTTLNEKSTVQQPLSISTDGKSQPEKMNWQDPGYQHLWANWGNEDNLHQGVFTNYENSQSNDLPWSSINNGNEQQVRSDWRNNENQKASGYSESVQSTSNVPSVQESWWGNGNFQQQNYGSSSVPESQSFFPESRELEWANPKSQKGVYNKPQPTGSTAANANWQQQPQDFFPNIIQNENINHFSSASPLPNQKSNFINNNINRTQARPNLENEVSNKYRSQSSDDWSWQKDAFETQRLHSSIDNAGNKKIQESNAFQITLPDEHLKLANNDKQQPQATENNNNNIAMYINGLQSTQNLALGTNTWKQQAPGYLNNLNNPENTVILKKTPFSGSANGLQLNNGYWQQPTSDSTQKTKTNKSPEVQTVPQNSNWGQSSQENLANVKSENEPSDQNAGLKDFNPKSNIQADQSFGSGSWQSYLNTENINIEDQSKADRFIVGQAFVNELLGLHPLSELSADSQIGQPSLFTFNDQNSASPTSLSAAKGVTVAPLTHLAAHHLVKSIASTPSLPVDQKLEILKQIPFQDESDITRSDYITSSSSLRPRKIIRKSTPHTASQNPVTVTKALSYEIKDSSDSVSFKPIVPHNSYSPIRHTHKS